MKNGVEFMKEILSTKSKRQLELMELLIDNEWVSFNIASIQLSAPVKTIKSDSMELNTIFAPTSIETSKKYGIRLTVDPTFSKATIYQKFLVNSIEFQLIEKIFLHNFSTINDLADDLYTSISTIKRLVSRINQTLQLSGFVINLKKMQLVGDAHSICNFMEYYFCEKYSVSERLLTPIQLNVLDKIIMHISNQVSTYQSINDIGFSSLNQIRFSVFTAINLLNNNDENVISIDKNYTVPFGDKSTIYFEFYRQFSFALSSSNIDKLFSLYYNENFVASYDTLKKLITKNRHHYLKYEKIIILIQNLEKRIDSQCSSFEKVVLDLYNIEFQVTGRTHILYDRNKEFYNNLKITYGNFPVEITDFLKAIFYNSPNKDCLIYEAIFILFSKYPEFLLCLEQATPTMKACLLLNTGSSYMTMISKQIAYYLKGRFSCTPLNITSLDELEKSINTYDCVITNIPDIQLPNHPIVVIPLVPDAKSFDKLMFVYEKHFKLSQDKLS